MWPSATRRFTDRVGITHPIVQGPFGGGLSSVALAAAVSDAGGLGSFGAQQVKPDAIGALVNELRAATPNPFAVNLWVPFGHEPTPAEAAAETARALELLAPWYAELGIAPPELPAAFTPAFAEQIEALIEAAPPAFSFVFGVPSAAVLDACKRRGIVTMGTATHVAEAQALAAAGVDVIVASGHEAGGHRVSFLGAPDLTPGASALIPQVADAVDLPIVAAGGVADGRGIVAALALGAHAVQVGTAFLACEESGACAAHRTALRAEAHRGTVLTKVFSGRLARGIPNALASTLSLDDTPAYPIQNWATGPIRREAGRVGRADLLALWAGQNVPLVRHRQARALFDFLVADAEARLAALQV